jgi:hypothetical protein
MHDMTTGRSVPGTLHLANKTPIDWYSKKAATAETASLVPSSLLYEYVLNRQLIFVIHCATWVYQSGTAALCLKTTNSLFIAPCNSMLSITKDIQCCLFYRVREAIVAGIVTFHLLSGDDNPADILSKHWG